MQVFAVKPVFAEPVEVRKLLIGQLIEIAIRPRGELRAHEVIKVQRRRCCVRPVARHHVGQVVGQLQARMGADQVRVVDIAVIQVSLGLHLCLNSLHHFTFTQDLVIDFDTGDFFKCFGQNLGLIAVGRNAF